NETPPTVRQELLFGICVCGGVKFCVKVRSKRLCRGWKASATGSLERLPYVALSRMVVISSEVRRIGFVFMLLDFAAMSASGAKSALLIPKERSGLICKSATKWRTQSTAASAEAE